ncbi:MAG: hypothetical protein WCJ91_04470, partial [Actinomycetes bacterium]
MNKKSALVVTGIVLSTLALGALPASAENALPTPTPSMGAPTKPQIGGPQGGPQKGGPQKGGPQKGGQQGGQQGGPQQGGPQQGGPQQG